MDRRDFIKASAAAVAVGLLEGKAQAQYSPLRLPVVGADPISDAILLFHVMGERIRDKFGGRLVLSDINAYKEGREFSIAWGCVEGGNRKQRGGKDGQESTFLIRKFLPNTPMRDAAKSFETDLTNNLTVPVGPSESIFHPRYCGWLRPGDCQYRAGLAGT